eukprot:TRINITY_DN48632_c0_g1_i1.p1 TRINITY_DN48632_c0_g1~~TRINITY_DN48632_c0_g1_i1.p1  ORF type:complete len:342 (-),score=37.27 TRINITY_DN48632_c0_g1_i1:124-1149(-)
MAGHQNSRCKEQSTQNVRVPGYVMLKMIGDGGQARVYKAARGDTNGIETSGSDRFAVKVYHGEHAQRSFQRELRCLSSLERHGNIVRLVESFEGKHSVWALVLELCGKDMQVLPFCRNLSEDDVVTIMRGALSGLTHMHNSDIVHRDVKPEHIAVVGRDSARLLDFVCASRLTDTDEMKKRFGSLSFMAPELFVAATYGLPVDMFAFGASLYYALGKQFPLATPGMTYEAAAAMLQSYTISFGGNFDHVCNDSMKMMLSLMHPCPTCRPIASFALTCPPFAPLRHREGHSSSSSSEIQLQSGTIEPFPPYQAREGFPRPTPLRKYQILESDVPDDAKGSEQ